MEKDCIDAILKYLESTDWKRVGEIPRFTLGHRVCDDPENPYMIPRMILGNADKALFDITDNIYIIGSLSQQDKIEKIGKCLMNNIYGSVRYVKKESDLSFNECISQCFDNIEWTDVVIVVKKEDGTIGDGVCYEMEYARRLNKEIVVI